LLYLLPIVDTAANTIILKCLHNFLIVSWGQIPGSENIVSKGIENLSLFIFLRLGVLLSCPGWPWTSHSPDSAYQVVGAAEGHKYGRSKTFDS
jgi:hypothetical protein